MNQLTGPEILQLFARTPRNEIRDTIGRQIEEAPAEAVLAALAETTDEHVTNILCYELGRRAEASAVPALLSLLEHPSFRVRAVVAESLGKIGDPAAGEPMLRRFDDDGSGFPREGYLVVQRTLIVSLGAVKHAPAIPLLIEKLQSPDPGTCGNAAWALAAIGDPSVIPALEAAQRRERLAYPAAQIRNALAVLRGEEPGSPL
jgi:HEAT repeat protein